MIGVSFPRLTYHKYHQAARERSTNSGTPAPKPAATGAGVGVDVGEGEGEGVLLGVCPRDGEIMGRIRGRASVEGGRVVKPVIIEAVVRVGGGIVVLVVRGWVIVTVWVGRLLRGRLLVLVRVAVMITGVLVTVMADAALPRVWLSRGLTTRGRGIGVDARSNVTVHSPTSGGGDLSCSGDMWCILLSLSFQLTLIMGEGVCLFSRIHESRRGRNIERVAQICVKFHLGPSL